MPDIKKYRPTIIVDSETIELKKINGKGADLLAETTETLLGDTSIGEKEQLCAETIATIYNDKRVTVEVLIKNYEFDELVAIIISLSTWIKIKYLAALNSIDPNLQALKESVFGKSNKPNE